MKKRKIGLVWAVGILFVISSCSKSGPLPIQQQDGVDGDLAVLKEIVDATLLNAIRSTGQPYDWNSASDELLAQALLVTDFPLTLGYNQDLVDESSFRESVLQILMDSEQMDRATAEERIVYEDQRLGFIYVQVQEETTVSQLRSVTGLLYSELPAYPLMQEELLEAMPTSVSHPTDRRNMVLDPYQQSPDYFSQVQGYSGGTSRTLSRHNVDEVYRNYQVYGEGVGVAVLDNGTLSEYESFMQANGYGSRQFKGYYNPLWFFPWTGPDGSEPQTPDVLFISQLVEGQWLHGWDQNEQVLIAAPNATQYSVRASPLVLLLVPSQTLGVINSIMAMADDPAIKISSMSMGALFRTHQLETAIDYYYSKDKLLFAAAGTSFLFLPDLIGVIYPASYEPVVAMTGIENREETNGEFVRGEASHVGPQVDFTSEDHGSSSEATSSMAGMCALVWSVNPELTGQEVLDIMIESSYFYQQDGSKSNKFGWGTPDILEAVELAQQTL